ncbi:multinuclear nonheme iron-dependent oxidase [Clostridium felsineum]|uniref:Uncharacterized protein n=1 Tax=Clostridium felsineum TaxID=36839 RepID=A0A1S8M923_9CLOT|nr:DUF692 family multinuclear iron-containing protein [Clostridium felsineum]MCR3760891.1 DUF692 family protein [Clostridium felsineum]URZ04425.1 hypothetical protein CLAUR_045140 [Clostridium felsineum]URZ07366.1 hypothetical protein CLROS_027040 [Clostridium felsineum]URZ12397.1 hypothetical protein CROST_031190 [Clostridium felsineum]URZ17057.1 hypothetical protein CLFE_031090 [Clostridium felsineum DSM 794]
MLIGCNFSKHLKFLLEKEEIEVDYIKAGAYGDFDEEYSIMRSFKPILVHGLGNFERTGMKDSYVIDFKRANKLFDKCQSPHFGIHIEIKKSDMLEGMNEEDIHKHMCKQIQIFKTNINVPLLLENVPDCPTEHTIFNCYPYFQPEKLTRLFLENDVDFLLDISHAKIAAEYHGIDIKEYLKELPLNRVREIHVNGSGYDKNGFPMDTHQSMEKIDYEMLEWVLKFATPKIVTLEYAGIKGETEDYIRESLKIQLKRIKDVVGQYI